MRLSKVLKGEQADTQTCSQFYRATVQAVLLFSSETWNVTPSALRQLEGFHTRCAWRMNTVNVPRKGMNGVWKYPSAAASLKEATLKMVAEYIKIRRDTVAMWVVNRPIYEACVAGQRKRGTSSRQWWWEQPMGLEQDGDFPKAQVA